MIEVKAVMWASNTELLGLITRLKVWSFWHHLWFSFPDYGHRIRETLWPQKGHEWNLQGKIPTHKADTQQNKEVKQTPHKIYSPWQKLFCFLYQLLSLHFPSLFFFSFFFFLTLQLEKGDKKTGSGWVWLWGTDGGNGFRLLWKTCSSRQTKQAEP